MLSERLRSLESEGLVERAVIPESPVRVEYELTTKGRELQSALREIGSWAERWIPLDENADTSNTTESNSGNLPANRRPRKKAASA
jgi:DNA-binding HxlR family transcriptional regulator